MSDLGEHSPNPNPKICIELDEPADRADGSSFTDHEVRGALVKKGFDNPELEWMRCTIADVLTVLTELRTGQRFTGTHHETFPLRPEQAEAVAKTHAYFHSIWKENMHAVPRFLWNAKMRFGKTFTTYQLAKKLGAKRVLVVTFKPAVEDAWQTDLESHGDFEGWQYLKSETVKGLKNKAKKKDLTDKEKKELTQEEKEYKSKRKQIQEKLIKFATRIPAFMYLTDFRENTLQDVITKLEPKLFQTVTGLTVMDFHLLVQLKVFNTEHMNQAVFAFRRYEDASLRYTGIESHPGLTHYGLYDTVVAKE